MDRNFVAAKLALKKLQNGRNIKKAVYIYGVTGYGKTTLVKQYLDFHKYTYWSFRDGYYDEDMIPEYKQTDAITYIVFDDFQLVMDREKQMDILKLIERDDLWIIIISRSNLPQMYVSMAASGNLITINEEDLKLKEKEIAEILRNNDIDAVADTARFLAEYSAGSPDIVCRAVQHIKEGAAVNRKLIEDIYEEYQQYLESEVIAWWDTDIIDFLMKVSVVDSFTVEMAEYLTNDDKALGMIERAMATGNFLHKENDVYYIRPLLCDSIKRYIRGNYGAEVLKQQYNMAGHYYELKDDIKKALVMYEQAGNEVGIKNLLVKNAKRNAGAGYYFELRKYYFQMDEAEIEKSPVMMAGMSVLYSVMLQVEKSEYWLNKLISYEKSATGGAKREASDWLIYAKISIPHLGITGMIDLMKAANSFILSKGNTLPEFSVTNNQPSTMNGGKDFCEWSKRDQFLADTIGKIVARVNSNLQSGFINAALAESFFEKGEPVEKVVARVSASEMEAEVDNNIKIYYAALGVQIRLSIITGNLDSAISQLESFRKKLEGTNENQLMLNVDAFRCRLALYEMNDEIIDKWMEQTYDENLEFCTLFRYFYMTKIRVYIYKGRYQDARLLISKMRYYAQISKRVYIDMKLDLYAAVTYYRLGEEWEDLAVSLLEKVSEYHFVNLVAEEGIAILPLLQKIKDKAAANKKIDNKLYKQIMDATEKVAKYYPDYLGVQKANRDDFSEQALAILRMQADGESVKSMAEKLHMSERTVKYHCSENYKKLDVANKTEAVQKAKSLRLI